MDRLERKTENGRKEPMSWEHRVNERLDRVEKTNRWLSVIVGFLVVGLIASLAIG